MFWADEILKKLPPGAQVVNDSKTPSGRVHIGALRGVIIHYVISKLLQEAHQEVVFWYGEDDMDPLDSLPPDVPSEFSSYLGCSLCDIPAPRGEENINYADYYMKEFQEVFQRLGILPKMYKMSELYRAGKLDEVIDIVLRNPQKIHEIYLKVSGSRKPSSWYPFNVKCEQCGKIATTLVTAYNGKEVQYSCEPKLVKWATGCSYRGSVSPFGGNGKFPWKLEWVAKWKVLGVTVEGAGKDHSTVGGAREVSSAIFKELFHLNPPYNIPYEFFILSGKKMSSSKGLGIPARECLEFLPPELIRFLMVKYEPKVVIEFNPEGNTIPRLFDEYDRYSQAYFEGKLDERGKRIFTLSQITEREPKQRFLPRFSIISTLIQVPSVDIKEKVKEMKSSPLTEEDIAELEKRIHYAQRWLAKFAPEEVKFEFSSTVTQESKEMLSLEQKNFLKEFRKFLTHSSLSGEEIHQEIYRLSQTLGIAPRRAFESIYIVLLGKNHGPRIGNLLVALDKESVLEKLESI
jgi:lysyl-tRNA synthetase class 1